MYIIWERKIMGCNYRVHMSTGLKGEKEKERNITGKIGEGDKGMKREGRRELCTYEMDWLGV